MPVDRISGGSRYISHPSGTVALERAQDSISAIMARSCCSGSVSTRDPRSRTGAGWEDTAVISVPTTEIEARGARG